MNQIDTSTPSRKDDEGLLKRGGQHGTRRISRWLSALTWLAVVAVAAAWASISPDIASIRIGGTVLLYIALASAWNLLGGYAGYLNFGIVIFLGVGEYTTAIISTATNWPPLAVAPLAAVIAAAAAVLVGIPSFRLRGDYFAVATFVLTLAIGQLAAVLSLTGGAGGKTLKPTLSSLDGSVRLFFLLFLGLAVLSVLTGWVLERTRWQSSLTAIAEDEDAAEVLGVPTLVIKLAMLAIGAAIAGLAGCLYASQLGYIEPTGTFDFQISLAVVVAAVVGGRGTWYGPMIGAVVTQLVSQELLSRVEGVWNQLAFGALLVVVVLVAPRGITQVRRQQRGRRFDI